MDRKTLAYVGNPEQLAGIRKVRYEEGAAEGLTAYQVKNGPLQFTVGTDKCLDLLELSWKGVNLSFLAKNGLSAGAYAGRNGFSDKSVMGGMCFTCGPDNVGPGDGSRGLPVHGSFRFTPARQVSSRCFYGPDGQYHMEISGRMAPAGLFEPSVTLERTVETVYGTGTVRIRDCFCNEGYARAPFLLLYHWNFSGPFLEPGCRLDIGSRRCVLREEMETPVGPETYLRLEEPEDGGTERVYFHQPEPDESGWVRLRVENPRLGIRAGLHYACRYLPRLIQWKSMVSGDYALGLEPSNCLVFGRKYEEDHGTLEYLEPGETRTTELEFTVESME